MDGEKKTSYKALTTNDIRTQARDWTLAGDVGLLAHLEQFSENVCEKTHQTQKYFNELIENYEEVHTKVSNITNQFLALQNCQFVENRVYDEETPTDEKTEAKVTNEVDQEKLLLTHYKEAVEIGVKLLDTHFQEVQLPLNSDSDEDEDDEDLIGNAAFVWKPKNPYAGKKFPLLIGSAEWWADDNIGLRSYEENPDIEKISESESEESSPSMEKNIRESSSLSIDNVKVITERPSFLKSSSEDLFGLDKNDNFSNEGIDIFGKEINPSLGIPKNFPPPYAEEVKQENESSHLVNENEGSEEIDNIPQDEALAKSNKKMDNAFTKELAAKLVSMNAKNEGNKNNLENLPADREKAKEKSYSENLFDDNVDDSNDLFFGKVTNTSKKNKNLYFDGENDDDDDDLFSKSNNLFFDSGANIIFESDKLPSPKKQKSFEKEDNQDENRNSKQKNPQLSKEGKSKVSDLFDDVDDEDTLFGSKLLVQQRVKESSSTSDEAKKTSSGASLSGAGGNKKSKGLFDEINDEFKGRLATKSNLFESQINDDLDFTKEISGDSVNESVKSSLFDSAPGDSPDEPLFTKVRGKQNVGDSEEKSSNMSRPPLFEPTAAEPATEDVEDLFSDGFKDDFAPEKASVTPSKNISFLDEDDKTLFLDKPKQQDSLSMSSSRSSLFDDVSVSKSKLASVFEKDKSNKIEDDLFGVSDNSLFGDEGLVKKEGSDIFTSRSRDKEKKSLFDDCDDTDDLFGLGKTEENIFGEKSAFDSLKNKDKEKVEEKEKMSDLLDEGKKNEELSKELENSDELFEERSTKKPELSKNDLEADENLFKDPEESVQEKSSKSKEKLFTDLDELDEVVTVTEKKKTTVADKAKLWNDASDLFADDEYLLPSKTCSEPKMPVDDFDDNELFTGDKRVSNDASAAKPKPPTSLNLQKNVSLEPTIKAKSVGKLNIPDNLKSKLESLGKASPPSQTTNQEVNKTDDLKQSFEPSGLLKCPSKDRVKIPGRRRPQSRRARQEALRNSGTNFAVDFEVGTSESENPKPTRTSSCVNVSQKKESMPVKESPEPLFYSPSVSNPLSPSTDEEDFFNVPGLDTNFEKEDQSIFKDSLFHSTNTVKMEDNFLFDGAPVLSPVESTSNATKSTLEADDSSADLLFVSCQDLPKMKTGSLFGDDDDVEGDDDSLFKTGNFSKEKEKKEGKQGGPVLFQSSQKSKVFGNEESGKKPLFDNIADDEDDLFAEKFQKMPETKKNEKFDKKSDENSQSKSKTNSSFVDPLGLMSNND